MAGRVDRVLNTALAGERSAVLNVAVAELLSEPLPVAAVIGAALDRPGVGVMGHWLVHELLRRSSLYTELLNALASPNPLTRAAAARVCGAARVTDAVAWMGDLLNDANPRVRDAAVRALADMGGRRAVEELMAVPGRVPVYRLAITLSRAASDVDIEALMRQPASEDAAVATVLACGLRRDVLRVAPLLGIAHDRRWPKKVRVAACKAVATIGDRSAADGLHRLAITDPDPAVKNAADRAYKRLLKRAVAR
ncbi:MAG TPA: HEAT repeat domain-containing protein [Candidatus Dormibacteraeota bacterium]|nr:HEAT repeat domain-containing protein [Candidatus Dormibacteraeota bacterium]